MINPHKRFSDGLIELNIFFSFQKSEVQKKFWITQFIFLSKSGRIFFHIFRYELENH